MTDQKRILIISYYFAPQNVIGAVRPTKLAKYLTRMGHEVTVIAGGGLDGKIDPTLDSDLQELRDVRQLNEWSPLRDWYIYKCKKQQAAPAPAAAAAQTAETPIEPGRLKKLVMRAVDAVYVYLDWFADRNFRRLAMREIRRLDGVYDVVFSSFAPVSVHETARQVKKRGIARKWIADFRDELSFPFACQDRRKQRCMQWLRKEADILCAVSAGTLETMGIEDVGRVLFNGFDREDLPEIAVQRNDDLLKLVYCGQFNMGRKGVSDRDLRPVFRALARAVQEGLIGREQLRLVYAGTEGERMRQYAAECGLEECVEDHGLVSRRESIRLQKEADILLLASWHGQEQRGILTGKMFEYMMMDKPILCCMNGDLPNSAVKQVMQETGIGFCWEEANAAGDDELLWMELCGLLENWKNGRQLPAEARRAAVEAYAYPGLARTLLDWINE